MKISLNNGILVCCIFLFGCKMTGDIEAGKTPMSKPAFSVYYRVENRKIYISVSNISTEDIFLGIPNCETAPPMLPFFLDFKRAGDDVGDNWGYGTPLDIHEYRFCLLQKSVDKKHILPSSYYNFTIPLKANMNMITGLGVQLNYLRPIDFLKKENLELNSVWFTRELKQSEQEIPNEGNLKTDQL